MRRIKAIKVVTLTEKERKKFTKKFACLRCHSFCVDTQEELDYHNESLHGEYPLPKHETHWKVDDEYKELYLRCIGKREKGDKIKLDADLSGGNKPSARRLKIEEVIECNTCSGLVKIHRDTTKPMSNCLICPGCGCNMFINNQEEILELMEKKSMNVVEFMKWSKGIDITRFNIQSEEVDKKLEMNYMSKLPEKVEWE
jgi:hypothetical protein